MGIKVVRHSEIMPREIQPCFSSGVIEHHIARIPGLAGRYLYANDDTLFWEETSPSFFFARDGYPYFRFSARRKPSANGVEQDYRCRLGAADALEDVAGGMRTAPLTRRRESGLWAVMGSEMTVLQTVKVDVRA